MEQQNILRHIMYKFHIATIICYDQIILKLKSSIIMFCQQEVALLKYEADQKEYKSFLFFFYNIIYATAHLPIVSIRIQVTNQ